MPFLMDAEPAVRIMADGILARRHRVDFPLLLVLIARFGMLLPGAVWARVLGSKGLARAGLPVRPRTE
jgi:hypothetical protein